MAAKKRGAGRGTGGAKRTAKKSAGRGSRGTKRGAAKRAGAKRAAGGAPRTPRPAPAATAAAPRQARAIQRTTRQSPYKMRLVIDEIRGRDVNEALNYLAFSKKHAAKQIEKVLKSAVANAE